MTRPYTGLPFLDAGRDQPGAVLAFAHRGGALHPDLVGLENTLVAFSTRCELGYTYLETDVHATGDGVLLAFHDDMLDRVTDRRGRVVEGRTRVRTRPHRRPRARSRGWRTCWRASRGPLEHRRQDRGAIGLLAELIERTGAHDRVCLTSFTEHRLARARPLVGRPVARRWARAGSGCRRFAPGPATAGC